jgi:hypothetical protein
MWDNRCTNHRVIPGTYEAPRKGIRTTVFGEKREFCPLLIWVSLTAYMLRMWLAYFDPASEGRLERQQRLKEECLNSKVGQATLEENTPTPA